MISLQTVVSFCDERTRLAAFKDAPGAFNGLQVANRGQVTKIGAAVDSGVDPFTQAVRRGVDFLIVHHGLFWDMPRPIVGPLFAKIETLLTGNCALYSNHLPLDGHPEIGNNALLARQVGVTPDQPFLVRDGEAIGRAGSYRKTRSELLTELQGHYSRVVAIEYGSTAPAAVAFCSGSGNSAVPELPKAGIDTLVTGELREEWFSFAQEHKLNLYLCGHYATEVHAVKALAAEAAARFGVPWEFIATDNPL